MNDRSWKKRLVVACLSLLMVVLAACGSSSTATQTAPVNDPLPPGNYGGAYASGTATGDTQAGADFARWVIDQDPQHQYMTDAVVRNEQTLGVKVTPTATKADVQKLLEALASGMSRTFPGKALTINAFYQSGNKLAEAHYDPSTQNVSVQFTG